jgi:uncharacterized membrane protein YeaQ/YmgE (transglycosylase-associated protein family)
MSVLAWIVFGFIVGLIARAVVPGRQSMGFVMTTILGVAGSLAGGLVGTALSGGGDGGFRTSGFIGSILGAVILLLVAGLVTGPRGRTV